MMIRARVVGAALLFTGLLLDAACSSSSKSDAQDGGGGDSETGGRSQAGASGKGGSAGAAKGGAPNKAGAGANEGDSAGASGEGGTSGAGGAGGEAGGDPCAACPSGFCLPTGECVACLPGNDHCPDGQYCSDANACVAGCKDDSSCASGVCGTGHDCQSCISDLECSAPHVCGAAQCAAACTAAQEGTSDGCSAGLTCCGTHCVDDKTDSQHCGACGTACAAGQLCGVAGCKDSTVAAACSVAKLTIVLDGQDGNAVPARAIAAALLATCTPTPVKREVSQDVADAVNATSGRPVAGGDELLISTGGGSFARLTAYLNSAMVAPIGAALNGNNYDLRKNATGEVVAHTLYDAAHDSSDVFVIQFIRDPSSGSLILNAQGLWQPGTTAAAYYFVNVMLPTLATQTKSWYVLQWTDTNPNLVPDAGDTFELKGSGP